MENDGKSQNLISKTQKIHKTAFTHSQQYLKHFYNYTLNNVHTEKLFLDTCTMYYKM